MARESEYLANERLACAGDSCGQGRRPCATRAACKGEGPSMFRQLIVSAAIVMAAATAVLALIGGAS